ncbi:hypothetical protein CTA2_6514 [Colletotrichum tanaceti]|uniref:Uncharacterized protein n=1 Tax=Colletotrichum tanaceti TaxID=1306861 RepID=A0A4V6DG73_9PEZI|nr:hypothetical protein CTA2_6514 [Colletotrichum tanaceti]TKW51716.1 hypothetical protein CTA1_8875 [Colletotrichum tanaceti]
MAHRLVTESGVKSDDLVLANRAGGYGGTWYWNRYPGGHTTELLTVKCQFLVTSGGIHPSPQIPRLDGLNGISVFRSVPGKQVIHTARWDWALFGGFEVRRSSSTWRRRRRMSAALVDLDNPWAKTMQRRIDEGGQGPGRRSETEAVAEDEYGSRVAERARWFSSLHRCTLLNSFLEAKIV